MQPKKGKNAPLQLSNLIKQPQRLFLPVTALLVLFIAILFFQSLALSGRVSQQEKQIAQLFSQVNIQQEQLATQEEQISDLEADKIALQNTINEKENKILEQQETIITQQNTIKQQQNQINTLNSRVSALEIELGTTTANLEETQSKLNLAEQYQTRVQQGVNLTLAYNLLSDNQSTKQLIINDGITPILSSPTDGQIWQAAKDIYDWIGSNFDYCGDKTIKVGESTIQFQFWSPDELLSDVTRITEANHPCGDCDDKAQLFAGMMYAAGIPNEKVYVVCGTVPGGGHCWNHVIVNNTTYRIDPVCSSPPQVISWFWIFTSVQKQKLPENPSTLDCFSEYIASSYYNTAGFHYFSS